MFMLKNWRQSLLNASTVHKLPQTRTHLQFFVVKNCSENLSIPEQNAQCPPEENHPLTKDGDVFFSDIAQDTLRKKNRKKEATARFPRSTIAPLKRGTRRFSSSPGRPEKATVLLPYLVSTSFYEHVAHVVH